MAYSLRVNHKQVSTGSSPDRNPQFEYPGRPPSPSPRTPRKERALLIVRDEFRPAIP
jgi:hypothetical protein